MNTTTVNKSNDVHHCQCAVSGQSETKEHLTESKIVTHMERYTRTREHSIMLSESAAEQSLKIRTGLLTPTLQV